jgi:hypothetical protein
VPKEWIIRDLARPFARAGLLLFVGLGGSGSVEGQEFLKPSAAVEVPSTSPAVGPSNLAPPKAVVRVSGTATPGLPIVLDGSGSTGQNLWYRWAQTQGSPVAMESPASASSRVVVPEGTSSLSFLLVVGNAQGADMAGMTVPIDPKARERKGESVRADAGDDAVGQVGKQVTLNGMRSEPRGKIGYRWLQMAGPPVSLKIEDGYVFSFVPSTTGIYQFALVVASGSEISEPDLVTVSIAPASSLSPPQPEPAAPKLDLKGLAGATLGTVEDGLSQGEALSSVFEGIAGRLGLYRSYEELLSELSRRLESIVPSDPARRSLWFREVFSPLTARVVERLRLEGLDLRVPEGRAAELTTAQRTALADAFRAIAEGFRSAGTPRTSSPRRSIPTEQ